MRLGSVLLLAFLLALPACVSSSAVGNQPGRRNRDLITREEIQQGSYSDAYALVQMLRPNWLQQRRASSLTREDEAYVRIYLDGIPIGGPETLRDLTPASVARLQYMDSRAATQRWGTNHPNGAIVVTTGR